MSLANVPVAPASAAARGAPGSDAAIVDTPTVRVVGPSGEHTPVLNTDGQPLQLKVVKTADESMQVKAASWQSNNEQVARVDRKSGIVRPVATGFATITAQTNGQGTANCFVAVMRVVPRLGQQVHGDTKADSSGKVYISDPDHNLIYRDAAVWAGSEI
jgi:hypothetical protein